MKPQQKVRILFVYLYKIINIGKNIDDLLDSFDIFEENNHDDKKNEEKKKEEKKNEEKKNEERKHEERKHEEKKNEERIEKTSEYAHNHLPKKSFYFFFFRIY